MRILVTGASGQLGGYLLRRLSGHRLTVIAWSGSHRGECFGSVLQPVDLSNPDAVRTAFREAKPEVVLHAGALARISNCHRDPDLARRINTDGSALLADLAAESGARLLLVSTDLVFDGERGCYREEDPAAPLSVYGRSKADAEAAVLAVPRGVVARLSLLYGPSVVGRPSFFDEQVAALRAGRPVTLFADEWRTPLALSAAAEALVTLAQSDCTGLFHLGGPERLSRLEMGQRLAGFLGVSASTIVAVNRADAPSPEPRPRDTSLDSSRWRGLFPGLAWPVWRAGLEELLHP
jgi:dTDP-4-dehydrorhamnose reductase